MFMKQTVRHQTASAWKRLKSSTNASWCSYIVRHRFWRAPAHLYQTILWRTSSLLVWEQALNLIQVNHCSGWCGYMPRMLPSHFTKVHLASGRVQQEQYRSWTPLVPVPTYGVDVVPSHFTKVHFTSGWVPTITTDNDKLLWRQFPPMAWFCHISQRYIWPQDEYLPSPQTMTDKLLCHQLPQNSVVPLHFLTK